MVGDEILIVRLEQAFAVVEHGDGIISIESLKR